MNKKNIDREEQKPKEKGGKKKLNDGKDHLSQGSL